MWLGVPVHVLHKQYFLLSTLTNVIYNTWIVIYYSTKDQKFQNQTIHLKRILLYVSLDYIVSMLIQS